MIGNRTIAVPGPTNIPNRIGQSMYIPLEDHRAPDLAEFTKPLLEDLKKIFRLENGKVVVFPGTGTGGWEAGLSNCLSDGDKVLTSHFGQFSLLWVKMCEDLGLDVENVECEWGEATPLDEYQRILRADVNKEIKAVLVCQNETASGVTSDVAAVREILNDAQHPALLMVDGISSIGCIEFEMERWGVDIAIAGSQKGFMMPTGLVVVALSDRVIEQLDRTATYYDFADMLACNEQGYYPYTPAMTLMRGLRTATDMLLEEGMENVWERHNRLANGVRKAVERWSMDTQPFDKTTCSDTVTAVNVCDKIDAREIINHAYHKYGISLGAGLGPLAGKVFRIGHLGWLNEAMILQVLSGVELTMSDLKVKFQPGSGVGAAIETYVNKIYVTSYKV